MANYRQIHVSIWKDEWFLDLEPNEKLLFIYLFSNESTSLSGLYKLALRVICFETGLDQNFVSASLKKFEKAGKAYYREGIVWVVNMRTYNRGGATVYARIMADIDAIPDCELKRLYLERYPKQNNEQPTDSLPIAYTQPTDTTSQDVCNEMKLNEMKLNEDSRAADAAAPPAPPAASKNGSAPLTEGQRHFLQAFGATRFKTIIQRDAVLELEKKHGTAKLEEGVKWAATKGLNLGDAIASLQKALPTWGQPKQTGPPANLSAELERKGYTHHGKR